MTNPKTAKILLVDPHIDAAMGLVGSSLRCQPDAEFAFNLIGATTLEKAVALLEKERIDTVLLAWELCAHNGGEAIEEMVVGHDVPVVVVSETADQNVVQQALKHRASDCVPREQIQDSKAFRTYINTVVMQREIRRETEHSLLGGDLFIEKILKTFDTLSIVATDARGRILYFNEGAEKLFGYGSRELVGKSTIDILYPDDDARARKAIENARASVFEEKRGTSCEVQEVTRDRRKLWLNLNLMPRIDAAGNVVGILGIGENITERKLAEERLLKSNERYRALLQLIPDIVYIIGPDGNFTFVSDSIKTLGYTPGELVGKHFRTIIHPDDYPNVARDYVLPRYKGLVTGDLHSPKLFDERRSGKRMTSNLEVRLVPKAGSGPSEGFVGIISAVNASGHYAPGDDALGKEFLGTIGVIRDITERKRAEDEHRRLEEQLNQAHKMEAIGRLAGGIAHDFNNMLSGIMGYAEVIKRRNKRSDGTTGDAELERYIDVIIKATERAGDLTEKLLAFSRQGKYQLVPVNIHDTIREVKGLLEHTIDRRIAVKQDLKAQPSTVLGDPTQIQNVILNLAMNARDAMPEGGALSFGTSVRDVDEAFTTALSFRMLPGRYLVLTVSDTGVGMDEVTERRIFEPFFTTKGVGEGVGLGLASVYGTVKSHHGAILVESAVGKGTQFSVYLPLHDEAKALSDTGPHQIQKGSGSILIVDDEEMVRTILTQLLKDLGYAVAACSNGGEAITYYRQYGKSIDLVILDMNMPVMSGAECLQELRVMNPAVKVIISTGYSFQSKTQKILATGVSGFVKKPFKLADLAEEIKRVLEEDPEGWRAHDTTPKR